MDHENRRDRLGKTIAVGLIIAVVFTALAFGAVEPWSLFLFEILIVVLLALWAVRILLNKRLRIVVPGPALPIAALVLFGIIQSVAITDNAGQWTSLSIDAGSTRMTVTAVVFMLAAFVLISNTFTTRSRLSVLSAFLVVYGLAMAIFALVQHFSWDGRFYWLRPTLATSPFGPFANHNHFAGYMELLIPLPVALVIARHGRGEVRLLYLFAAGMMGVAAVTSLSRGGMISLVAGMLFIGLLGLRLRREKRSSRTVMFLSQAVVMIAIMSVIGAGIFWIGADPVLNRVKGQTASSAPGKETFLSSRGWIWRDTFSMIRANPVLGVGLGAYETAFSIYSKSDGSLRVPQAHNDYLQVTADAGIVGALIALWFIVAVFRDVSRGVRSGDRLLAGLALGTGGGIFAILVHSMFDFNLQVPSNALLFLLLVSVASSVAASVPEGTLANQLALRRGAEEHAPAVVFQRGVES
jgi:O-antigen ligase